MTVLTAGGRAPVALPGQAPWTVGEGGGAGLAGGKTLVEARGSRAAQLEMAVQGVSEAPGD